VFEAARPAAVALEQPPPPLDAPQLPAWVAAFLEAFDAVVCEENLSPSLPSRSPGASSGGGAGGSSPFGGGEAGALAALRVALAEAAEGARDARVGRDILDPGGAMALAAGGKPGACCDLKPSPGRLPHPPRIRRPSPHLRAAGVRRAHSQRACPAPARGVCPRASTPPPAHRPAPPRPRPRRVLWLLLGERAGAVPRGDLGRLGAAGGVGLPAG
jgi:hypothetical protein